MFQSPLLCPDATGTRNSIKHFAHIVARGNISECSNSNKTILLTIGHVSSPTTAVLTTTASPALSCDHKILPPSHLIEMARKTRKYITEITKPHLNENKFSLAMRDSIDVFKEINTFFSKGRPLVHLRIDLNISLSPI